MAKSKIDFKALLALEVPDIRRMAKQALLKVGYDVHVENGCLFAINPEAKGHLPLAVAHMDMVGEPKHPTRIWESQQGFICPDGTLGGDDRCGIWVAMNLAMNYARGHRSKRPHIFFSPDEERGSPSLDIFLGRRKTRGKKKLRKMISWILDLDRRGSRHFVCYRGGEKPLLDWLKSILPEWKKETGTYSDLARFQDELEIDGINLAVGFHDEHRCGEYVVMAELEEALDAARLLVEKSDSDMEFECDKPTYTVHRAGYNHSRVAQAHFPGNQFNFDDEEFHYSSRMGYSGYGRGSSSHGAAPHTKARAEKTKKAKVSSSAKAGSANRKGDTEVIVPKSANDLKEERWRWNYKDRVLEPRGILGADEANNDTKTRIVVPTSEETSALATPEDNVTSSGKGTPPWL